MKNIQINSKNVSKGDIYIAISCDNLENNVKEAIKKDASIIFVNEEYKNLFKEVYTNTKLLFIEDTRLIASKLAKFKYDHQPNYCVAITGTNGKSSTAHFVNQIWSLNGKSSANLGTLGLFVGDKKIEDSKFSLNNLTTPDPFTLHEILEYLYDNNIQNVVFEASSHALVQKRLHNVELAAAAFTNLAIDHLDYHKTKDEYFKAKLTLFEEILSNNNPAIVLGDSELIYNSVKNINKNVITFGILTKLDIYAYNIKEYNTKIIFDCIVFDQKFEEITINLFGRFQILNVLCAVGIAYSCGLVTSDIINILPKLKPLDGRMEHIASHNGGEVYVDYAHTAEGFKNSLECFRKVCAKKLICVFGCGGDRDKTKRAEMGKIAQDIADIIIITDDNPRTENPKVIRLEILKSCPQAFEIANRKEAIKQGMSLMQEGDFLIIIGKGHESFQIYADKIVQHHDKEEILLNLQA
jgi:UDP-N-acetylmuramoyl-L-alanyl-D-glutamate--2,6-diaminopimelate ligase